MTKTQQVLRAITVEAFGCEILASGRIRVLAQHSRNDIQDRQRVQLLVSELRSRGIGAQK